MNYHMGPSKESIVVRGVFIPMTTLKLKWQFALFAALLYITAPLAEACYYLLQQGRGAYAPNADSIAIPLYQFTLFLLFLSPFYAATVWVAVHFYQGGRSLLAFDTTRPVRGILWSLLLGGSALFLVGDGVYSAYKLLPSDAVSSFLWAYLLLCLRSSLAGNIVQQPEPQVAL